MEKLITPSILCLLLILAVSCETEKRPPLTGFIPPENTSTENLQVAYFWQSQENLNAAYWNQANYCNPTMFNGTTEQLPAKGYLNMSGTYQGLSDFNQGNTPNVSLKAGYDTEHIYILVEWDDTTQNAANGKLLWNGPDDPLKKETTDGWTAQGGSDNIALIFENQKKTQIDAWYWSLAQTAPFNMALNTNIVNNKIDRNTQIYEQSNTNNNLSPKYEWNDQIQKYLPPGETDTLILDPAYYLLSSYAIPISGDVSKGQTAFNQTADCRFCHGPNGNGIPDGYTNGGALYGTFISRYTKQGLIEFISSHEGGSSFYFGRIKHDAQTVNDLVTFLRALPGFPGQVISIPEKTGVTAQCNATVGGIREVNNKYQVLFSRKLNNNNNNDIQFSRNNNLRVKVRVFDNDFINYIESEYVTLEFQSNEL